MTFLPKQREIHVYIEAKLLFQEYRIKFKVAKTEEKNFLLCTKKFFTSTGSSRKKTLGKDGVKAGIRTKLE